MFKAVKLIYLILKWLFPIWEITIKKTVGKVIKKTVGKVIISIAFFLFSSPKRLSISEVDSRLWNYYCEVVKRERIVNIEPELSIFENRYKEELANLPAELVAEAEENFAYIKAFKISILHEESIKNVVEAFETEGLEYRRLLIGLLSPEDQKRYFENNIDVFALALSDLKKNVELRASNLEVDLEALSDWCEEEKLETFKEVLYSLKKIKSESTEEESTEEESTEEESSEEEGTDLLEIVLDWF